MRLIDADALKNEFIKEFYTALGQGEDSFDVIGTMAKVIDNAPTIEVTKVKCKNKDKYWCYSQCPYADTCENGIYER